MERDCDEHSRRNQLVDSVSKEGERDIVIGYANEWRKGIPQLRSSVKKEN